MEYRDNLKNKKRIVIKIGSSSLLHEETGSIDFRRLEKLVRIVCDLKNQDKDDTRDVAGILLYAKTDEDIAPDFMFNMGGNQIGAKTLDLMKEFPLIAAQLDRLAEEFFNIAISPTM